MTLGELLVEYIKNLVPGFHVGKVIPDNVGPNYVWVGQVGEEDRECFAISGKADHEFWSIEVWGPDVAVVEDCSKTIKSAFRGMQKFADEFQSQVEFFRVTDADDEYQWRSIPADERKEGRAIQLTVFLNQEHING